LLGAQTVLAGFLFGLMNLLAERRAQRAELSPEPADEEVLRVNKAKRSS
jgi:hypothetical protein